MYFCKLSNYYNHITAFCFLSARWKLLCACHRCLQSSFWHWYQFLLKNITQSQDLSYQLILGYQRCIGIYVVTCILHIHVIGWYIDIVISFSTPQYWYQRQPEKYRPRLSKKCSWFIAAERILQEMYVNIVNISNISTLKTSKSMLLCPPHSHTSPNSTSVRVAVMLWTTAVTL